MIKYLFIAILGPLFALGCTRVIQQPAVIEVVQPEAPKAESKSADSGNVDPDLVYLLLAAEIAGQRGAFDQALDGYLQAAERTGNAQIAERATQIALFLRNSDMAASAVSLWIANAPDNSSARKAAILVYLSRGDEPAALEQIGAWFKIEDEPFRQKMENLVKILDKGLATPLEIMQKLEGNYRNNADFLFAYAVLAFKKNELAIARKKIGKVLKINPEWEQAVALSGRIVAIEGGADADRQLEKMVEDHPDNSDLRFIYGQYLIKAEKYKKARVELEKVVALDPENYEATFGLAGLNLQLDDLDAATKLFLKLKEIPEWADQSYLFLGRIEKDRGNYQKSLEWLDQVSNSPLASEAGLHALLALGKLGRYQEVKSRSEELARRFPDQAVRIYLVQVELFTKQKSYDQALALLNSALKDHPEQSELLYSRALVAERLDRLDILEADLGKLLEQNPEDVNALNALGYTLVDKTTRLQEARKYLERAIRLKPNDPVIVDSYGWLQYKLGNFSEALDYLNRAFKENPDPEIAAHLGEVLWVSGQTREAKSVWKKAISADPESEYLLKVKDQFPEAFPD